MKELVKIISKNNKALIESYQNNFGEVLSNQNDRELFLSEAYLYLYMQINKTIFALENKENNSTTVTNLFDELTELKRIFFKFLQKKFYSNSWENIVELMKSNDAEYSYITPTMFNEKHLYLVIQRLNKYNDLIAKLSNPKSQSIGKIRFDIALEFANGNIYKLLNNGISQNKIAEIIFANRKSKVKSYRSFINNTLSFIPSNIEQNIFKKNNAEKELNEVVTYCNSNKISISTNFIEDCKKYKIFLDL